VRYEGRMFRPPSEARSLILQATIGCSWNHCVYCDMYRDKAFRIRPTDELTADLEQAAERYGPAVETLFVADGDALVMGMDRWEPLLERARKLFPRLRRISSYAMASNVLAKTAGELARLREQGLSLLYLGPESGDEKTMRRIAKGPLPRGHRRDPNFLFDSHVEAARRARAAGMKTSAIFLLGAGGTELSDAHARGSARLATAMDPDFVAALTLTVVPGTPIDLRRSQGRYALPDVTALLGELRTFVAGARPTDALFRTNHASNYLPLAGRLPRDGERIVATIDAALGGTIPLRPEFLRGL
jgi:radical SAM superfamily enzyme YgiQ (UPF0313 family)